MFTVPELLAGAALPLALGAVMPLILRGDGERRLAVSAAAVGVAAAAAHATCAFAGGAALLPPTCGWHRLPFVVAAAAILMPWLARGGFAGLALIALGGIGASVVLIPLLAGLGYQTILWWTAGVALANAGAALLGAFPLPSGMVGRTATIAVAGTAAVAAGLSGSKDLALLAGILPLILIPLVAVPRLWTGIPVVVQLLVTWNLAIAGTYADLLPVAAGLIASSLPLAAILARLWPGRPRTMVLIGTAVPLVAALALVLVKGQPDTGGY